MKPIRRMTCAVAIVASLGMERFLFTFAITENLQNVNNTPDIGFQLGRLHPAAGRGAALGMQ